jgi:hypothetical protein
LYKLFIIATALFCRSVSNAENFWKGYQPQRFFFQSVEINYFSETADTAATAADRTASAAHPTALAGALHSTSGGVRRTSGDARRNSVQVCRLRSQTAKSSVQRIDGCLPFCLSV